MFSVCSVEIAQLTSSDSGIAETPETDDSVSVHDVGCFLQPSWFTGR